MDRTPAVIDFGLAQLQHEWSRVWEELAAGGAVRAVNKRTGLMAAWITLAPPQVPGIPCVRLSVNYATHNLGKVWERARHGGCTEVRDHVHHRMCHIHGVTPAGVLPVEHMLPGIIARTRSGRLVERAVVCA
jgi:hypothetical protein